ncbi:MAG: phenylacetate--CoA ligase family protein [Proteobacteria bacterium]|nr:phenylacetate--CoA ligase family protein [Pseudomonadota bacterium]
MTRELLPPSCIEGIVWPPAPSPRAATLLAMQFELEQSQWLPPADLRKRQFAQIAVLLRHAMASVPFHRERLAGLDPDRLDEAAWLRLPILERTDVQEHFEALKSSRLPPSHGRTLEYGSSGSSGRPIRVLGSEVTSFFWQVLSLRDHLWHRRDFAARHAAIRTKLERGRQAGWDLFAEVLPTGPMSLLGIHEDIDTQLDWLRAEAPSYLITHPSNLRALAKRSIEREIRLPELRETRTFGEMLRPDVRELCRQAWDVPVTDIYSAEEAGVIALQCPDYPHYHVQAENLLVEVLDPAGIPCRPGETGSIVVTTLHNFAMPLIRYRLRDFAVAGSACPCGRGLPVLERIVGRQRNMLVVPDGRRHWPSFPGELWVEACPAVRQFQLIQHTPERIEARVVVARAATKAEIEALRGMLIERFGYPFLIDFSFVDRIEPGPNCKYEDFVSHVAG